MSTVVTRYLDKCKAKITEAQEKYGLTDCFHLNLEEEVSPLSVFDDLCLDKEDPKRAEREVVYREFGIDTICPTVLSTREIDRLLGREREATVR